MTALVAFAPSVAVAAETISAVQMGSIRSTATSWQVTLGSAPTQGNLLLLLFTVKRDDPVLTLPSGFQILAQSYPATASGNVSIVAAAKIAGASEGTGFTVTLTNYSGSGGALLVREYSSSGVFDLNTLVAANAFNYSSSNTTTHVVGPLTVGAPAGVLVGMAACNNNVTTWSGTWTNSFTPIWQATGANAAMAVVERYGVGAGTYSTQTTVSTSRMNNGLMLALVAGAAQTPLFTENFASSAGNFTVVRGGTWGVSGGRYVLSNPQTFTTPGLLGQLSVHNTALVGDYSLSAVVRITGTTGSWDDAAVVFGYQDVNNHYYVSLNESNDQNTRGVFRVQGGVATELADISQTFTANTDYTVSVERSGSSMGVRIGSTLVASVTDGTFAGGKVGFGSKNDGALFDDLTVYGQSASDTQAPSTPTGLAAINVTNTTVDLTWNEATDNIGVVGYKVYTGGSNPVVFTENLGTISGLSPNTSYTFTVRSIDAANNESSASSGVNVTTASYLIKETFGSTASANNFAVVAGGTWTVSGGNYVLSNPQTFTTNGLLGQISVHNAEVAGSMFLSAVVNITGTAGAWDDAAVIFGYHDAQNYYYVSLNESNDANTHGLFKVVNNVPSQLADFSTVISANTNYTVEVGWTGSSIVVEINGTQVASVTDATFSGGQVGFGSKNDAASFDTLVVEASPPAPDSEPPSVPTSLAVGTRTATTIALSWSAATDNVGVAGYRVYTNGSNPLTVTSTGTTVTGLTPSTNYTFTVAAFDDEGNQSAQSSGVNTSTLSSSDTQAPTAPTNLSATAISANRIDLAWTASTDNVAVAGYDIFRNSAYLASTTTTSYQNTELEPNTSHSYYVVAYDTSDNDSSASNTANATTPQLDTQAPTTPTNLASSNITSTSVNLSWTASTDNIGVTGYKVYTGGTNPKAVTGTSTTMSSLAPSTAYSFTVSAIDAAGNESAKSSAVNATTSAPSSSGWAANPYVSEPLQPRGSRVGRYPARCPNINRGSIQPYLDLAGEGSNSWTTLGRTVYLPAGYYDVTLTDLAVNRSGWLNLVAAEGEGSVEFRGRLRMEGGRVGIRFIGIDMLGQWYFAQGAQDICFWGGIHQNPNGVNSAQPHVMGILHGASRVTIAGTIARRSRQDLYKITSPKKLLIQGVLGHEVYWDDFGNFHSDGIQTTGAAEFKLLDSYFCEDARGQFGQDFSYPIRTYWARVAWTGTPNNNFIWGKKGQPEGPLRTFGAGVVLAPTPPDAPGWDDWDWSWNSWRWASRRAQASDGGVQNGTWSTAKPSWHGNDPAVRSNTWSGSPDKVWRANNAYSSWSTYFQSSASSFDGAEGTVP